MLTNVFLVSRMETNHTHVNENRRQQATVAPKISLTVEGSVQTRLHRDAEVNLITPFNLTSDPLSSNLTLIRSTCPGTLASRHR